MSRVFFGVEKGIDIFQENGDLQARILSGTAAPDGLGDQSSAPIGSIYLRSGTGELYQKIANAGNSSDWQLNGASAAVVGSWRPESLVVVTNETQGAGTRDVVANPFSDDEGTPVPLAAFQVDKHIITDADGTPLLLRISAVVGNNVTFVAASSPLVADDTFVTRYYLPDSPDNQEDQAIVNFNGSIMVKIADINWSLADGISLLPVINDANGPVVGSDTLQVAIEKLEGDSKDLSTLFGLARGAVNLGAFTAPVDLLFSATSTVKALFQRIGDLLAQLRGVEATGITAAATVDSVPHATVKAVKWLVEAFEEATPANRKAVEIYALTNGVAVDDTVFAKLDVGSNFNLQLSVDISGADMRLRAQSSTAGVTVRARRIEVVKSVL